MFKQKNYFLKNKGRIFLVTFFVFCLANVLFLMKVDDVVAYRPMKGESGYADPNAIKVSDAEALKAAEKEIAATDEGFLNELSNWADKWLSAENAGKLLSSVAKTGLKEAGKYLADVVTKGAVGESPSFHVEGFEEFLTNTGNAATGVFLEDLGKGLGFNFCDPNAGIVGKIGLGLLDAQGLGKPSCTYTKMKQNWEEQLQDPNFSNNFKDYFNPYSNDLSLALTVQGKMYTQTGTKVDMDMLDRTGSDNWRENTGIDKLRKSPPKFLSGLLESYNDKLDASAWNISFPADDYVNPLLFTFAQQLALNMYREKMLNMELEPTSSPGELPDSSIFNNPETDSSLALGGSGNILDIEEVPFEVIADYKFLTDFSSCDESKRAGPKDCVVDNKFITAIQSNQTVGQAIKEGNLNKDGFFGFWAGSGNEEGGAEANWYNGAYPYRSMKILRKYRIIPVGWELAAQYIKDHDEVSVKTLGEMVECFNPEDEWAGYYDSWCEGLVDPDWLLKVPSHYCGRSGPGPEIMSTDDSKTPLKLVRATDYCADEKSCILTSDDGSCEKFGYCVEDERKWRFSSRSCEARYNTCQSFEIEDKGRVSYLKNTLDYGVSDPTDQGDPGVCGPEDSGCMPYAISGNYDTEKDLIDWDDPGPNSALYYNDDLGKCDESAWGCHEFILPEEEATEPADPTDPTADPTVRLDGAHVFLKLVPNILKDTCQIDPITNELPDDAPPVCYNFVYPCNPAEEEDPVEDCTACCGFDYYPVEPYEHFRLNGSPNLNYPVFNPAEATRCSRRAVGCSEFTNKNENLAEAERIEYYSALRKCEKLHDSDTSPDAVNNSCGAYYTWKSSEDGGLMIEQYYLKSDSVKNNPDCSVDPGNPGYDPECINIFTFDGSGGYREYDLKKIDTTICSDDCVEYRMTETNPDNSFDYYEQPKNFEYSGLPTDPSTVRCSIAEVDCRAFNGPENEDGDSRIILNDDFETGSLGDWGGNDLEYSTNSETDGHSMAIKPGTASQGSAVYPIATSLDDDSNYLVDIRVRISEENVDGTLDVKLGTINGESISGVVGDQDGGFITDEWATFKIDILSVDAVDPDKNNPPIDSIVLESGGNYEVYVDYIRVTEVSDLFYFIYGSWPEESECDPDSMMPCDQCTTEIDELGVECASVVDTQNSLDPSNWVEGVANTDFSGITYDPSKSCGANMKGCERMGMAERYPNYSDRGEHYAFLDVFRTIDPDETGAECTDAEAYCISASGQNFKDPGKATCEWAQDENGTWAWWKTKISRCGGAGEENKYCISDADCDDGVTCEFDDNLYPCPVDSTVNSGSRKKVTEIRTIGPGGESNFVEIPRVDDEMHNWTGLCPNDQTGCTEYIDPVSNFTLAVSEIKPYTLYNKNPGGCAGVDIPNAGNLFFSSGSCDVAVDEGVREIVVGYQIQDTIEKADTVRVNPSEGLVIFNERSIDGGKYQELTIDAPASYRAIPPETTSSDANDANSVIKVTPDRICGKWLACKSYVKDENSGAEVCFDVAECDSLDEDGSCSHFIVSDRGNQYYNGNLSANKISNMTGYVKVGYDSRDQSTFKSDYYRLSSMRQAGGYTSLSNGGFEFYGSNKYPIGWNVENGRNGDVWSDDKFRVELAGGDSGICYIRKGEENQSCELYNPEGGAFLRYAPYPGNVVSEYLDVDPDTEYILSAFGYTKNLAHTASARISIEADSFGTDCPNCNYIDGTTPGLEFASGIEWHKKTGRFKTGEGVRKIRLNINAVRNSDSAVCSTIDSSDDEDSCVGEVFLDDIQISPALEVQDVRNFDNDGNQTGGISNLSQSCRLFPTENSLSCDYYEESGARKKGWMGYCLEYDSYPGRENACLMWYPVDKVHGDGYGDNNGYRGRFPLYYALGLNAEYNLIKTKHFEGDCAVNHENCAALIAGSGCCITPNGTTINKLDEPLYTFQGGTMQIGWNAHKLHEVDWDVSVSQNSDGPWHDIGNTIDFIVPGPLANFPISDIAKDGVEWFQYVKIKSNISGSNGTSGNWGGGGELGSIHIGTQKLFAERIVQVVTATGGNKYWSGRVSEGSGYAVDCNRGMECVRDGTCQIDDYLWGLPTKCDYGADYFPFGAMVPPGVSSGEWNIVSNPYEWDSKENEGIQPMYYEYPNTSFSPPYQARAGQIQSYEDLRKIFAQSYGTWKWEARWACTNNEDNILEDSCVDNKCLKTGVACSITNPCESSCKHTCEGGSCNEGTGLCEGGELDGSSCGGCRGGTCDVDTNLCVGGDLDGKPCNIDENNCPDASCVSVSRYIPEANIGWSPADIQDRPVNPKIGNIHINGEGYPGASVRIVKNGFVNLTFTTELDVQQKPLVMYSVDWGDGQEMIVSGINLTDQPNANSPHSLYHLYNYYDLVALAANNPDINPSNPKITIKIRDNWGATDTATVNAVSVSSF